MDKYELLEKFISEIQQGKKPQIETEDKEVLEILSMAQKLAVKGKKLNPEFEANLEKAILNNINKEKPVADKSENKPSLFPKWAYFTALAAVVVLIGGLAVWQNQRSKLVAPGLQRATVNKSLTNQATPEVGTTQTGETVPTVTITDIRDLDQELLTDLSDFEADFNDLGSLGDELSGLDADLGQIDF